MVFCSAPDAFGSELSAAARWHQNMIVVFVTAGQENRPHAAVVPSNRRAFPPMSESTTSTPAPSVRSCPLPDLSTILPFDTASMSHQITGSGRSTAHAENPADTETSAAAQQPRAQKRQALLCSIVFSFQFLACLDTAGGSAPGYALGKVEMIIPQVCQNVVREITITILRTSRSPAAWKAAFPVRRLGGTPRPTARPSRAMQRMGSRHLGGADGGGTPSLPWVATGAATGFRSAARRCCASAR